MIKVFGVPSHETLGRGVLSVINGHVPFPIKRLFWITGIPKDAVRGGHAHRKCYQFIVSISGRVKVSSTGPGLLKQTTWLTSPYQGILVPPLHWLDLTFQSDNCELLVLASDVYKDSDYIRVMDEFQKLALGAK